MDFKSHKIKKLFCKAYRKAKFTRWFFNSGRDPDGWHKPWLKIAIWRFYSPVVYEHLLIKGTGIVPAKRKDPLIWLCQFLTGEKNE